MIYKRQKRFDAAESLYKQILELVKTQDIPFNKCIAYGNYGDLLGNLGRYDEALEKITRSEFESPTMFLICATSHSVSGLPMSIVFKNNMLMLSRFSSRSTSPKSSPIRATILNYCTHITIFISVQVTDKAMTLFTEAEERFHSAKYGSHTSTFELRLLTHNLIKRFYLSNCKL